MKLVDSYTLPGKKIITAFTEDDSQGTGGSPALDFADREEAEEFAQMVLLLAETLPRRPEENRTKFISVQPSSSE